VEIVGVHGRPNRTIVSAARPIFDRLNARRRLRRDRAVLALFEKSRTSIATCPENAYVFAMNVDEPGWLADWWRPTIELEVRSGKKSSKSSTQRRAAAAFDLAGQRVDRIGIGKPHPFSGQLEWTVPTRVLPSRSK